MVLTRCGGEVRDVSTLLFVISTTLPLKWYFITARRVCLGALSVRGYTRNVPQTRYTSRYQSLPDAHRKRDSLYLYALYLLSQLGLT